MNNFFKKNSILAWVLVGAGILFLVLIVFLISRLSGIFSSPDTGGINSTEEMPDQAAAVILPTPTSTAADEPKEGGDGCDWSTCSWMPIDQCVQCGRSWLDYGDESYCGCSTNWESQLEWCKFEGGEWLLDESRCTFQVQPVLGRGLDNISTCLNIYYQKESSSDTDYDAFKEACKAAGGVDQCWDADCSLAVCQCPAVENVSGYCDWAAAGQISDGITSEIKCYDDNGTCWLTIQPTSALMDLADGKGQPEAVITTSDGQAYSSINLKGQTSGCIYDESQISCLIKEGGSFNVSNVENVFICQDLCCLNLGDLETGVQVDQPAQAGDCPSESSLEVTDFQLVQGWLNLKVKNDLGWGTSELVMYLNDAKGDYWTTLNCKLDSKYDQIMDCEGWAVYKSGYATMSFSYPSSSGTCVVNNAKFTLPWLNPCSYTHTYCASTGECCSSGYTCCSCGCRLLDTDEPDCETACVD